MVEAKEAKRLRLIRPRVCKARIFIKMFIICWIASAQFLGSFVMLCCLILGYRVYSVMLRGLVAIFVNFDSIC